MNRRWRPIVAIAIVVAALTTRFALRDEVRPEAGSATDPGLTLRPAPAESLRLEGQVEGVGVVQRILPDDTNGSRHQRFILALADGRTVLVAHNIDLAPRLTGLDRGDTVAFFGEFEPNPQGGVIHWTHRDPAGRHVAGWLKHEGRTVQ